MRMERLNKAYYDMAIDQMASPDSPPGERKFAFNLLWERYSQYADIGTPEELAALKEAQDEGRRGCNFCNTDLIGSVTTDYYEFGISPVDINKFNITCIGCCREDVITFDYCPKCGRRLTREAAEAALEAQEENK